MYQGHPCAFRLNNGNYYCGAKPNYSIGCTGINYDGKEFGWEVQTIPIATFFGSAKIAALTAFPLEMHPDKEQIKQVLVARGRKFEDLRGIKHQHYSGPTLFETRPEVPVYHVCPFPEPVFVDDLVFT